MRKLFWSPYELGNKFDLATEPNGQAQNSLRRYYAPHTMGGLGLTTLETVYEKDNPNENSLVSNVGYKITGKGFLSSQRITYARILATSGPLEGLVVDGYVIGKDYVRIKNENAGVLFDRLVDLSPFSCFKEFGDAVQIEVEPVKVIPLTTEGIDQHFENWELFEEGGMIYGKRLGKVYELVHHRAEFKPVFGGDKVIMNTFTIGGDWDEIEEKHIDIDPFNIITKIRADDTLCSIPSWLEVLQRQLLNFKVDAINKGMIREDEVKINRIIGEWKGEVNGV